MKCKVCGTVTPSDFDYRLGIHGAEVGTCVDCFVDAVNELTARILECDGTPEDLDRVYVEGMGEFGAVEAAAAFAETNPPPPQPEDFLYIPPSWGVDY